MLAYAEVESNTPGAVRGMSYKKDGKLFLKSFFAFLRVVRNVTFTGIM